MILDRGLLGKIDDLQKQLEQAEINYGLERAEHIRTKEEFAASQAREQVLLEALRVSHTDSDYQHQQLFLRALSTPSDDTALREYGAKLLEEMAVELGVCEHKCDVEVRNKAAELRSGD